MALKVSAANRPNNFDDDGFVVGVIKSVALQEAHETDEGRQMGESVLWTFETPGTLRPYLTKYWTGLTLAPADEKGELTKLTRLCLSLGLVQAENLDDADIELDLEQAIGLTIRYTLKRQGGLYRLDGNSISLDDTHEKL